MATDPLARLPRRVFGTIVVDPPWLFQTYSAKGQDKSASVHYPTMTLAEWPW
jgi:hypothetical protein